jgi:catechol 2,3-dioxygenase-like lactoylglutathione lyase family enzyme
MMTAATTAPTLTSVRTGHVALNVTDIARSRDFYRRLLGLSVAAEGNDGDRHWVFLGRDGALILTLFQQSTGRFSTSTPGLHHLSFQVENMDQVRVAESIAHELGAPFFHESVVAHSEGSHSGGIFFADPDGTRLEIFAPQGAEAAPAPSGKAPTCGFF